MRMKLTMSGCARVVVPRITRFTFLLYACLAVTSFREAKKIFDKEAAGWDGRTLKTPITFCTIEATLEHSYDDGVMEGEYQAEKDDYECMDATLVANIVPVTAVLSLAAICLYVLMWDLVVRGRAQCCHASSSVSSGVAAGFGAALSILLFQSMWGFLTIAFICDHYEKSFSRIKIVREGQSYTRVLTGSNEIIWATGAAAAISCLLSAIDATILFRTSRPGPPASTRGDLGCGASGPAAAPDAAAVVIAGGKEGKFRWKPGRGHGGNKCKTGVDQQAKGDVEAPPQPQENAPTPGANPFL